mmetsp:Transcript_42234/g.128119  ORF Transcript_42234/g.128119 Transcript_42234/m.128119 type:complete len:102 (-) Transcript_42234:421-726(-)
MIITGIILDDLNTVWTGKLTYRSDAYCDQLDIVLLRAQGVNAISGATLFAQMAPCFNLTAIIATIIARKRFENTQKAALGNLPSGACVVAVKVEVMINSCM